jgi:deoxycytidine triphosphate deaminase
MGILADWQIKHICRDPSWRIPRLRLEDFSHPSRIYTRLKMLFWKCFVPLPEKPLITPYTPENVGCSSLDICIGDTIKKSTPDGWLEIDLSRGQKYALHYGEFYLSSSGEVFNFPLWLVASVDLRSTSARLGCQHLKAGHCEPGWNDSVCTLELHCVDRNRPFIVQKGQRVCQMIFYTMDSEPLIPYSEHGRYNGDCYTQEAKRDARP